MPELALTEAVAWALIIGGVAYAVTAARGVTVAAVTAAVAALATKSLLLVGV